MFKKVIVLFAFALGLLYASGTAYAKQAGDDWSLWTTVASGSETLQSNFGLTQQPYGYLFIDKDSIVNKKGKVLTPDTIDIKWVWYDEGKKSSKEKDVKVDWAGNTDEAGNFQVWTSPKNWAGIANPGDWTVQVNWSALAGKNDTVFRAPAKTANFSVVSPEPVSALLFLFGGIGLAARRLFSRKRA